MKIDFKHTGSAMIVTVFAVAIMAVLTIGILQINTEELQIVRNQIYAAQAMAVAEAGLNDAFAQLRSNPNWNAGFTNKAFLGNSYTIVVTGSFPSLTIESIGTTSQGFVAKMTSDVTIGTSSPYVVRIDKLRINE